MIKSSAFIWIFLCLILSCTGENKVDITCSRVYIDAADFEQLDYQQYIQSIQASEYFNTLFVHTTDDGQQHLLEINLNIFMNRPSEMIEGGLLSFEEYDATCHDIHSVNDTILIARRIADDKYSVYRVRSIEERRISDAEVRKITGATASLMLDRQMSAGQNALEGETRVTVNKLDTIGCSVFHHIERIVSGDTCREVWVDDMIFSRVDSLRELTLMRFNNLSIPEFLNERCE